MLNLLPPPLEGHQSDLEVLVPMTNALPGTPSRGPDLFWTRPRPQGWITMTYQRLTTSQEPTHSRAVSLKLKDQRVFTNSHYGGKSIGITGIISWHSGV